MKKLLIFLALSFTFYSGFSQKVLGQYGQLVTTRNLYVDSPLYKINDSTIGSLGGSGLWKQASNYIYKDSSAVYIYNDTAAAITSGSAALVLQNRATPTSGHPQYTPALSLIGSNLNLTGSIVYPFEWRIFATEPNGYSGIAPSTLTFLPINNGVVYASPFSITSSGTMNFNSASGNAVTATTYSGLDYTVIRKIVGTSSIGNSYTTDYSWLDILPTINYSLTTGYRTYRGIYYHPNSLGTYIGAGHVAFENTTGENRFNSDTTMKSRTGFGVIDSVNKSAAVEIKSTTMGVLLPRMTKTQRNNIISSLVGYISSGGSYANAVRVNVLLGGGSGSGARADLIISGTVVTNIWIRDIGSGYKVGDVLTVTGLPGGGSGLSYTLTTVGAPADGLSVIVTGEIGGSYLSWYNASTSGWVKATSTSD